MPAKKGQSKTKGSGRTKGTPNKITRTFKEAMLAVFNQLGGETHLLGWAKGDPAGFYRIMARFVPPGAPVRLNLAGEIAAHGQQVIAAMANGEITPEQASAVMQTLSAQARIIEVDELERRVAALEEHQHAKAILCCSVRAVV